MNKDKSNLWGYFGDINQEGDSFAFMSQMCVNEGQQRQVYYKVDDDEEAVEAEQVTLWLGL